MNTKNAALWGLLGTVTLTTIMSGAQGLGFTRMSLPFLLGTMVTPDRKRAKAVGFGMHLVLGWLFAFVYTATFHSWRRANWWLGVAMGLGHALFALVVGMGVLPAFHPRMATEESGPTPTRMLEPPGFLGLNYGPGTPLTVILAHLVYGALLGTFYRHSDTCASEAA